MSDQVAKEVCIQTACFFLPFFEAGEWRTQKKSPWRSLKNESASPDALFALATYTEKRIRSCGRCMAFLLSIHDDWCIKVKKEGVWMMTRTMIYEDILPQLKAAGISENEYILYSEYTRAWGML
ncbi:MAG: hypothetical protein LBD25_07865 [Coriobacteriales bacterium]|jgi:hypothetical protein|nr:hypothetical protein [Coriobacteriales bacterium]